MAVTESDWHTLGMDDYTDEQRSLIASEVERARLDRGWGKEEAGRHAKISSITWKRVEDGLKVQTTKLRAIEVALGWGAGSMDRVARGRDVAVKDTDTIEQFRARGWADHDDSAIWEGFRAATQFAQDAGARGANPKLVSDFVGDAVALLAEVGRVRAHPETSALLSQDELDAKRRARDSSEVDENLTAAADRFDEESDEESGGSADRD